MLILGQYQVRNQDAGQIRLAEAVTHKKDIVLLPVQKPLELKAAVFYLRGVNRIFFISFGENRRRSAPFSPAETEADVIADDSLIQPSCTRCRRYPFTISPHAIARR